jgi:arginine-tRNA-protein transferase
MLAQAHCPSNLTAADLDLYLSKGWFRMGQTIFTTNFLSFKNQLYSAIWLRVALHNFEADKTQRKLIKLNRAFRVEIKTATVTPQKEMLFQRYKTSVAFEASDSVQHLLFGKSVNTIYNTLEVNIYDADKLIAVGFFDVGEASAAGISCFYDPDYKKYSLGKYLIYLKMAYCKKINIAYFYPGYLVPGYTFFNYKLDINKNALQYLPLSLQQWVPISDFAPAHIPLEIMIDKLKTLQTLAAPLGLPCHVLTYEFYDARLIPDLRDIMLFDFPVFMFCFGEADNVLLIVYDVRDAQYHFLLCKTIWASNSPGNINERFTSHILKVAKTIFSSPDAEAMVAILALEMKM